MPTGVGWMLLDSNWMDRLEAVGGELMLEKVIRWMPWDVGGVTVAFAIGRWRSIDVGEGPLRKSSIIWLESL